jgi:hypothetical protein
LVSRYTVAALKLRLSARRLCLVSTTGGASCSWAERLTRDRANSRAFATYRTENVFDRHGNSSID